MAAVPPARRSRPSIWWWELTYRIGPNLGVIPFLMAFVAVLAFAATRRLDAVVGRPGPDEVLPLPEWLLARTPADADVVLSAFLGALSAALALVFSTTVLTFSLASTQLGPRLIRRFMQDPVTQVTLGLFLSAVVLCALTLGSVRTGAGSAGVPIVSYALAVTAGLSCFFMLVVYIHRVAVTIQAPTVVASVVEALDRSLDEQQRPVAGVRPCGDAALVAGTVAQAAATGGVIVAPTTGFIQVVDHLRLVDAAEREGAVIVLEHRVGQFVVEGRPMARVLPARAARAIEASTHHAVEIGPSRTRRQDTEYAIYQVVEIALRALSPAVNDTFTGMTCVDWLGAALCRLGTQPAPTGGLQGPSGTLHLYEPPLRFDRALPASFDLIRQSGAANPAITIRLLDAVAVMATVVRPEYLGYLRSEAGQVLATALATAPVGRDAEDIRRRHGRTIAAIDDRLQAER